MDQIHVAKVYANALLEIGKENKSLDILHQELGDLVGAMTSDEQVWGFFQSPRIDRVHKVKVLDKFANQFSQVTQSLARLLIRNDRTFVLKEILKQFSEGRDKILGIARVQVQSAFPLEESDIQSIQAVLTKKLNGQCVIETIVKPELIGGVYIRFGDNVIDGSIKSQLESMKKGLLQKKLQSGTLYEG